MNLACETSFVSFIFQLCLDLGQALLLRPGLPRRKCTRVGHGIQLRCALGSWHLTILTPLECFANFYVQQNHLGIGLK